MIVEVNKSKSGRIWESKVSSKTNSWITTIVAEESTTVKDFIKHEVELYKSNYNDEPYLVEVWV